MELIDGDVVKRLRALAAWAADDNRPLAASAAIDGADEIERLRGRSANPADHRYWKGRYRDEAKKVDSLVAALADLRKSAALLLQNSIGCAANHYGDDYQIHGLPGWLADCEASIEAAAELIPKEEIPGDVWRNAETPIADNN